MPQKTNIGKPPAWVDEEIRKNEPRLTLSSLTCAGIQSLAKKLWVLAQSEGGHIPSGNWEYLNNQWVACAIMYIRVHGLASDEQLATIARAQIEKNNSRAGVYLTKTGRLAHVVLECVREPVPADVLTSAKTKAYRRALVNPVTEHVWTHLDGVRALDDEAARLIIEEYRAVPSPPSWAVDDEDDEDEI